MSTTTTNVQTTQVYQVFILATPEQIWDAITKPEFTERYFHGVRIELRDGRRFSALGDMEWDEEILEADEPRRLVHRWIAGYDPEMAGSGEFSGPVILLAPSLSRVDESKFPRALDRLSSAFGHLPYALMLKIIGPAMKSSLPAHRREVLIAELQKNDPRFLRRQTRAYLEYLDRHGSLAWRLCDSGVRAWVVFGEDDDIGLTDEERDVLEKCPSATLVTIADAGHFALNQRPGEIAEILLTAVSG